MVTKIALAGNPNCGKTTLFNLMTSSDQYVGNRPGVTVEKTQRQMKNRGDIIITDLPGVYSLSPFSPEEIHTRTFLLDGDADVTVNLIDSSNLARSLYLTTQLIEIGKPMIIALNMVDKLEGIGGKINSELLSEFFGIPVITVGTSKGEGIDELTELAVKSAGLPITAAKVYPNFANEIILCAEKYFERWQSKRFMAIKALEGDSDYLGLLSAEDKRSIKELTSKLEQTAQESVQDFFAAARYKYIDQVISVCLKTEHGKRSISRKIDDIVLNKFLALPIFFSVLFLIYYVCITVAGSAANRIIGSLSLDTLVMSNVDGFLKSVNCSAWLQGLVTDGIIPAVGSVLEFLPQIFMLFFSLGVLEESGYMARVAFLSDRVFRSVGLSGKSFIPLLIGSGCSVPAVMATRTIENDNRRRLSIIVTPFIPCSAKLTVISFISSAIFGGFKYTVLFAFGFAVIAVFLTGVLLKDSRIWKNKGSAFIMELPSYCLPSIGSVTKNAAYQSFAFIKKAGSVILLSSVAVWFLSHFTFGGNGLCQAADFKSSMLGSFGSLAAPFFAPLGFGSSEMSVAVISGLFAKENIVGTLEVLLGGNLESRLSFVSALAFLAFNLLCPPCIVAVNAMRRELNSAKHTLFALAYQTVFAYAVAFMIYQFGRLIA